MPAGRPSKYTKALGDKICRRIAGGESLRSICASDKYPNKSTVLLWIVDGKHTEFSDQYHAAREAAGYSHADEALDLRNQVLDGSVEPNAAKVVLDALKWGAERMSPKRHSQRQELAHSSPDGSMTPQPTRIEMVAPGDNSTD